MGIKSPAEIVRSRSFMRVLDAKPIDHGWWLRLSAGAKSGRPHYETFMDLHLEDLGQEMSDILDVPNDGETVTVLPDFPGDLDEVDAKAPPVSQDEGLALLARFLRAERGELAKGAEIHVLHWLLLCGLHCPKRERYAVLREFVNIGFMTEKQGGIEYADSGLKWPLVIMPPCVEAIETLLYVRKYVPHLYSVSRRGALVVQGIPGIRNAANALARLLSP